MPPLHGASPSRVDGDAAPPDREFDEVTVAVDPKQKSKPPRTAEDDPLAVSNASWASHDGADRIGKAVHSFFYPERNQHLPPETATVDNDTSPQQQLDWEWMDSFWKTYDDIIFLSLFSQLGILFRLGAANWFNYFDHNVFSNDSPLFVNLPLNCLSCFIVGLLGDGESLLSIIFTRFTPNSLLQNFHSARQAQFQYPEDDIQAAVEETEYRFPDGDDNDDEEQQRTLRRRRRFHQRPLHTAAELPPGLRQRRPVEIEKSHTDVENELREVQMLAFGRRIRASKCLILFSGRKEDVDVMEHYFDRGYTRRNDGLAMNGGNFFDLSLQDGSPTEVAENAAPTTPRTSNKTSLKDEKEVTEAAQDMPITEPSGKLNIPIAEPSGKLNIPIAEPAGKLDMPVAEPSGKLRDESESLAEPSPKPEHIDEMADVAQPESPRISEATTGLSVSNADGNISTGATLADRPVAHDPVAQDANAAVDTADDDSSMRAFSNSVSEHFARMQRVRLVDGWDVKSTPEEMSDDLMLGLRDGFCGAVSSFSSWNSAMVALLRQGQVNKALVGYCIGIQLPIIFYRFGQHVAVFLFMWKCRQETKRDERRGYGIRINQKDDLDEDDAENHSLPLPSEVASKAKLKSPPKKRAQQEVRGREIPSVRAIATALFILSLVTQFTSLSLFTKAEQQLLALSLLFSPLGTLARWRLGKLNSWRRRFPLGTFSCNILACALSGSLGSILAGNPGPRERVFLVSVIAGFGGTLSSVAAFVVEILAGIDPLLLRLDGFYYAVASIFWAGVVGFIFTASGDWADVTTDN